MRQEYGRCGYKVPAAARRSERTLRERLRIGQFLLEALQQWFWGSARLQPCPKGLVNTRALASEVSLVALRGFRKEPLVNFHAYGAGIIAVAIFESVLSSPLEFTAVTW
jgi:hypothetical protein